ncbi:MAG: response regulator [bacterium]
MKILMIDDDQLLADLVKERLDSEGFEVCVAFDGLSGIECMIKESPDLILLDIMMPGIDGYEVCKKLKESPATASLPIVFVSARNAQEDIDKAFKLGADDYIVKPFDTLSLGKRLNSVYKKISQDK